MASKAALLARYGDGSADTKKKKKKKQKRTVGNVVLVDEEVRAKVGKPKRDVVKHVEEEEVEAGNVGEEEDEEEMIKRALAERRAQQMAAWKIERESPKKAEASDASPPRKSNADASPLRRRHDSPGASPVRRRHDSPEASPLRRRHDSPDASPVRKRHDSPDASPVRKRHDSPDASPKRGRHDSPDASPKRRRHDSPDSSPPPRKRSSDASPQRKLDAYASPPRRRHGSSPERDVLVDRRGRKLDSLLGGEEPQFEWGGGVKQDKAAEDEAAAGSFTISVDDAARDAKLKDAVRWGDPMAGMISSSSSGKRSKSSKKDKKEVVLEYFGPGIVPNRFNIRPGAAWDGRDRSNGFEARWFKHKNAAKVAAESSFAWSVNDM